MVRGVRVCEMHSKYDDDKSCTSGENNDSDWKESSSEEDESSDSNSEELATAYRCRIVFFLFSPPFFQSSTASYSSRL